MGQTDRQTDGRMDSRCFGALSAMDAASVIKYKLDGKYSERVQLPAKAKFVFFCRQHLATLATPTIKSIKCKQSPVYRVF